MNLHTVFLSIFTTLNIVVFVFVTLTLYEFYRLDKEQFKFYIIGLFFYGLSVFCVFLRYVVLPPISTFESITLEYGLTFSALVGIFYFIKETEILAQQEKSDFVRNETLKKEILYLIVAYFIFLVFYALTLYVSESLYELLTLVSGLFMTVIVVLALKLLLEYKKVFGGVFAKIIFQYVLAVMLFIAGGIIVLQSLTPIETGDVFTDLSYTRQIIATAGAFIVVIPFIICFKSVNKFRKMLMS